MKAIEFREQTIRENRNEKIERNDFQKVAVVVVADGVVVAGRGRGRDRGRGSVRGRGHNNPSPWLPPLPRQAVSHRRYAPSAIDTANEYQQRQQGYTQ